MSGALDNSSLLKLNIFIVKKLPMFRSLILPFSFCSVIVFSSCNTTSTSQHKGSKDSAAVRVNQIDGHPGWIMQGNVYEVNVRQYTPQGTFKAFENNLDRLKNMGVQTLWFMPLNPISMVDRKGALGSYYAVSSYTTINPEFGTLADWKELVQHAHNMGFKVIIDWVPNHTGADHPWLKNHGRKNPRHGLGHAARCGTR